MSATSSRDCCSLFVNKFDESVTEDDLRKLFAPFGTIVAISLRRSVSNQPYAFVDFQSHEQAQNARNSLNGTTVNGTRIIVKWRLDNRSGKDSCGQSSSGCRSLFVSHFGGSVTKDVIRELFTQYGRVVSVFMRYGRGVKSQPCAFVEYQYHEEAQIALHSLNGVVVGGQPIVVTWNKRNKFENPSDRVNGSPVKRRRGGCEVYSNDVRVHISNIDSSMTSEMMKDLLSQHGKVLFFRMCCDESNRPFAFARFESHEQAQNAIETLNGKEVNGTRIIVRWFIHQDVETAWSMLSRGDGSKSDAASLLRALSHCGDGEAMWMSGVCCEYGVGTKKLKKAAKMHYGESRDKGSHIGAFFWSQRMLLGVKSEKMYMDGENHIGMIELIERILPIAPVKVLSLKDRAFDVDEIAVLCEYLKTNTSLTKLHLNCNYSGLPLVRSVSGLLMVNTSLTYLDLNHNSIGDEGTSELSRSLLSNSTLVSLFLSYNYIGCEGVKAISVLLNANTTLTKLDLSKNEFGDEGARILRRSLENNTTLTSLNLSRSGISIEGEHSLWESLAMNSTLTDFNVCDVNHDFLFEQRAGLLQDSERFYSTLCVQHGLFGRLGRLGFCSYPENNDITYVRIMHGVGRSSVEETSRNMRDFMNRFEENEQQEGISYENRRSAQSRIEVATAELLIESNDENDRKEGMEIIKARSKYDVDCMLSLGLMLEFGLNGLEKDEQRACEFYDKCNGLGVSEGLERLTTIKTEKSALNPANQMLWGALLSRLKHNTMYKCDLSDNNVGDDGVQRVSEALVFNSTLTDLNLERNSVGNKGIRELTESLIINTTLTTLNLSDNWIEMEGAKAISELLLINTTLTELNMNRNNLGEGGARMISDALMKNNSLTALDLGRNRFKARGAAKINELLSVNTTLTKLNLSLNSLGDEGARKMTEALLLNSTLIELDLSANGIGVDGIKEISDALMINTTLAKLNLRDNNVGVEGAKKVYEALMVNSALTSLDVTGNDFGDEGTKIIVESLALNTSLTELFL